ncbi:twin-arginine translocase subunit TatC [Halobaculum sp. MBLA0143]|uniref:twin-arginine translocase subunit TatC n=1 Tax=Halobaculum sp. MBLA0143 TaxID=3079933 RepID=UPI0035264098
MTDGSDGDDERPADTAGPESDDGGSAPDADTTESHDGGFSRVSDDERTNGSGRADFQRVDGEERSEPDTTGDSDGPSDDDGTDGDASGASADTPVDDAQTVGDRGGYDRPRRDDDPPATPDRDVDGVADDRLPDGVDDQRDEPSESSPTDDDVERHGEPGEDRDPDATPEAPLAEDALVDRGPRKVSGDATPGAEPVGAGTGTAGGGGTGTAGGAGVVDDTDDDGLFGEGPESDEEMPLTEHIEEMMRRLGAVFAVGGAVTLGVLVAGNVTEAVPNAESIITFLWDSHVGFDNYRPYVYGPLELLLTKLKVAGLAGVVAALPVFVYQTYRFMRPGLYPNERRYYLAAVPTSLVLALVGIAFAHFVVLPAIFQYFIGYTEASAQLAFGLRETFNLILLLMGYMAVVFQIPLFIQLATMMGVVSRVWLEQRRLLFWGSFLGISFVLSPDPTGMSPIIVAATMVVLFEGTLALLRWTGN